MRKQPNKYRNQLGPTATSYMVLVGLILAVTGFAFVYVKNKHLAQEDRKGELKAEIARYNAESEHLKLKVQMRMNPQQIVMALVEKKSGLIKFPPAALTKIPSTPLPGEIGVTIEDGGEN